MATAEERMKILKMVEESKISAEDGAKLLAALNEGRKGAGAAAGGPAPDEPRWFRVRITDLATGKAKVNLTFPMSVLNTALKMGARFAPGLDSDRIKSLVEAFRSGASGKIVEATDEEAGEQVEIFVE
jgi:hypothetical protein